MNRLRKKLIILITMLVTALVLSGCVRMEFNVTIKSNGKLDVSMLCAASDALNSFGDSSMFDDEEIEELKKEGYSVSRYSEDGYVGYIASINDVDPSKLASDNNGLSEFTNSEHLIKKGNTYILDFDLMDNEDLSESMEYLSMIENAGGYMRFNLTTPVKATNHNASFVSEDGKTLTWNLLKMNGEPIHAEFKLPNKMMYIGAGIIAVLILIGIAVAIMKKKKPAEIESSAETIPTEETVNNSIEPHAEDSSVDTSVPALNENVSDQLRELKKLLDDEIITQEDFDKKKQQLLNL